MDWSKAQITCNYYCRAKCFFYFEWNRIEYWDIVQNFESNRIFCCSDRRMMMMMMMMMMTISRLLPSIFLRLDKVTSLFDQEK